MKEIIRDVSMDADRNLGILEVWYPDESFELDELEELLNHVCWVDEI